MINENELPKNWQITTLKEIASKIKDGSHNPPAAKSFGLPMISAKDVQNNKITFDKPRFISEKEFEIENKRTQIESDDVLLTIVATIGRTAVVPKIFKPFTLQRSVAVIKTSINPLFLCYYFQSKFFQKQLTDSAKGTAQKGVYLKTLSELEIIVPPLAEQERIVAKIEELFSELDAGLENLKTAQAQLKTYRQAVLKYAFEGKLTNDNLNEAELLNDWKWVKLGDYSFVTKLAGFEFTKHVSYSESGDVPVIRAQNVSKYSFVPRNFVYVEREVMEKLPRSRVYGGEILMVFVGAGLGNVGILPENTEYFLGPNVAKIALKPEFFNKYILHFLSSTLGFANVNKMSKATAQGSISMGNIREVIVPFCSLEEQQRIVEEIESRLSVCDKLEETINSSLKQAEALRQSILKQAFEGKLIAQEVKTLSERQIRFHQLQVLGLILIISKIKKIQHGQMTSAKYLYLLDKIFGVKTHYNFKRGNLGPFPADFKKTVNNSQYFVHNYGQIEVINESRLFNSQNPNKEEIEKSVYELVTLFQKYNDRDRPHKTELLATVCKVIEDIQTTEIEAIRQSMAEWKIDLKDKRFSNKAEKFDQDETAKCVRFIIEKGWDKKLIK